MWLLRRIRDCRSGSTAVEFAIVGMSFVLLSIGIVEFGRGLHLRNQLAYAADVGVRKALTDPAIPDGSLDSAIREAFRQGNPSLLAIDIENELADGGPGREITIRYPLVLWIPGLTGNVLSLGVSRRIPVT